ncbi:restriction endonuclease [Pseudarthrobacter oxydans]|uniref:restriction endonuclease n=1 Tax=Pseudarthrobacter oxydans TaxID=1671 RepID=UPI00380CD906
MELDSLLTTFDKVAVNIEKLERVWERAKPFVPEGPQFGSPPEYQTLSRAWADFLSGLPPIDGWRITEGLPEVDSLGQMFLDYKEIGVFPKEALRIASQPDEDLSKYRHLLDRARRRAIAVRLTVLAERITELIAEVLSELPDRETWLSEVRSKRERIETPATSEINDALEEIERLLGQTVERRGRWGDLRRHLRFGEVGDWHDIFELDWPSVQEDIEAAKLGDTDPIPVPDIDLGTAVIQDLTGGATTALNWSVLQPEDFERLLFDLLRDLDGYQNVDWLMKTNAPDRGRDISLQRVVHDAAGTTRIDRVIVQAKHYTTKSVGPSDIQGALASLSTWEPPVIRSLIIATSSRFSSDAVTVAEKHNDLGNRPHIELWPDSRLETLLAQRPKLAITYGLRT